MAAVYQGRAGGGAPVPFQGDGDPVKRYLLALFLSVTFAACGGDGGSPTSPSPAPNQQTRIIHIDGDLDFGDVRVGESVQKTLRVFNQGNSPMTVTGITGPTGNAFTASFTQGTIQPNNGFQDVTIRFTPTEHRSYSGTATIQANHTAGSDTKQVTARGVRDPFTRSGSGPTVFDMPTGITRVRITGNKPGSCENFIIWIGGRLVVNEIIGTCSIGIGPNYDGTHLVSGTVVEVRSSIGVNWTITEIQQ